MSTLARIWSIAVFEVRQSRRMLRTWILGIIALVLPLLLGAQTFAVYRLFGGFSASWATVPKDVWIFQSAVLSTVTFGLLGVFLAFDWRHRDESQHFEATWEASGASRLELAWGRFLGIALILGSFILALTLIQVGVGLGFGIPLSPSTFLMTTLEIALIRSLAMTAVAFGIAGLTGSRALAVVLSLAWLVGSFTAAFTAPEWVVVPLGGLTEFPLHSDFVGYARQPLLGVQSLSIAALVAFFVTLGGLRRPGLPRNAGERTRLATVAAALAALWVGAMAGAWWIYESGLEHRRAVVAAETAAASLPSPLVVRREIDVQLDPGDGIEGEAGLRLRNETGAPLEVLPFRLDPGLEIVEVADDSGSLEHARDETVVRVTPRRPMAPGEELDVTFRWEGAPVGSAVDAEIALRRADLGASQRGNARLSGGRGVVFEGGAVALGSDAAWYPEPGVVFGHSPPSRHVASFAPTRLSVTAPDGWTVASGGVRGRDGNTWTFESEIPVPGASLNAARFAELEGDVGGLTVRVLHHPDHVRNIEEFAVAADALREWAAERLDDFEARTGLAYPHSELTIVEVPQQIDPFAPGWDAGSQLGPPGVVMLRESTFFTAQFGFAYEQLASSYEERTGGEADSDGGDASGSDDAPDEDGDAAPGEDAAEPAAEVADAGEGADDGAGSTDDSSATVTVRIGGGDDAELSEFDEAQVRVDMLRRYFQTDWTGGNVERLVLGHAWEQRLQAVGPGSAVLGPGLDAFVAERAMGVYSVSTPEHSRIFNSPAFGRIINAFQQDREEEVAELLVSGIIDLDDVYELMLEVPLDEMNPSEDPVAFLGVLFYKARKPLQAVHATLGDDGFAQVLTTLLEDHAGGHFRWDDFRAAVLAAADEADREALSAMLDNWIGGTALPGFVVEGGSVTAQRLAGEEERWQVFATVANQGEAAGMARLRVGRGRDARSRLFVVPAGERVRVGLVAPVAPERWSLDPYLALNRTPPAGSVSAAEETLDAAAIEGVTDAPPPPPDRPVVVDNVDAGFEVALEDGRWVRYGAVVDGGTERVLEEWPGFRKAPEWMRWRSRGTWHEPHGTFDNTAAVKTAGGGGGHPARWTVENLASGTYRVEAYLPPSEGRGRTQLPDSYHFTIETAEGEREVDLDLSAADAGWNELGRFRIDGEARVLLHDRGEGLIVADAVRFAPVGSTS